MKKILLLVLLLSGIKYTYAQSSHLKFDHFTVKEGLPERTITFIKQDDQGYIWMGTQNGLLRYDGYKPKVYRFGVNRDAIYTSCSVESMVTDKNKNLWVSTYGNGLFRYDRSKDTFIQYKYPQKPGEKVLKDQNLALVDSNNNLWAFYAAANGDNELVRFNQKEGRFENFNYSIKGAHHLNARNLFYIIKSTDGTLWLGAGNGLFRYNYNDDQFHLYQINDDKKKQDSVFNIYETPSQKGELWLISGTPGTSKVNLVQLNTQTNKITYYNHGADKNLDSRNDTVNFMLEDSKKRLWFATQNGMLLFNRDSKAFTKYLPADTDKDNTRNQLHHITEAKNGTLWITSGKGLLNFHPVSKQFQRYVDIPDDPTSVAGNTINKLLVDRSGTLFAAVRRVGLIKNNPLTSVFSVQLQNRNRENSYPGGRASQVTASADGYMFFTNPSGVYKWKPGSDEFTRIYRTQKADGVPDAIMMSTEGLLYFNTRGTGLQVYNLKTNKLETYLNDPHDISSVSSNYINIIKQDHFGKIWIGTDGNGICSFDPITHKFKQYPYITNNGSLQNKGKLDDERVMSIYEDKDGALWVGTNLGGLNRLDRKTGLFKSYLFTKNVKVFSVIAIGEDHAGKLWIGTYLNGLFEFDPKTESYIRHFNEDNGLLFNSINTIVTDDKGILWITSERGLTRLNPTDLSLKNYRGNEIFSGSTFTADINDIVLQHGVFAMALNNGISVFDPAGLAANTDPPIVHIEKIGYSDPGATTDSSTVLQAYGSHGIELPYNQNRITFSYIALHFAIPSQNKYAYLLEGYDKNWVQAGTQRSVTYTNLSPGTYTFRVKASNSDGVWNNEGDSFLVIVDSPLWFRWWAWVIYIIVFILVVSGFIAYRSRQLKMENQELEEKVTERTQQLSQANKELSEQQEEITTQRDKLAETVTELKTTQQQLVQSEKLASLGELTAGIAHEIQNPLNFVNNFAEVSVELVDELAEELSSDKRDPGLEEELIADLKQNLEKINHHGKRADGIVKNMLQHSRANSGESQHTDINALADEYMRLAYHGLRSKEKTFNALLTTNLDPALPKINVIPQDIGRVLLNLFNNAFYAVHQKQATAGLDYKPEVAVTTSAEKGKLIIKVKDNGNGIPDAIKDKIMQPFFTTKPTGEGTGLGLSLSYDIVVKGHGGSIKVETKEGEGTEFIVELPAINTSSV